PSPCLAERGASELRDHKARQGHQPGPEGHRTDPELEPRILALRSHVPKEPVSPTEERKAARDILEEDRAIVGVVRVDAEGRARWSVGDDAALAIVHRDLDRSDHDRFVFHPDRGTWGIPVRREGRGVGAYWMSDGEGGAFVPVVALALFAQRAVGHFTGWDLVCVDAEVSEIDGGHLLLDSPTLELVAVPITHPADRLRLALVVILALMCEAVLVALYRVRGRLVHLEEIHILESNEIVGSAWEKADVGVVISDPQCRVSYTNALACRLLGGDVDDDPSGWAFGQHLLDPRSDEALVAAEAPLTRALRGEVVSDVEFIAPTEHMSTPVRVSAFPVLSPDGEVRGAIAHIRDVRLDHLVAEELLSARNEAIESNRSRTVFLSYLSHEIREPLRQIVDSIPEEHVEDETGERAEELTLMLDDVLVLSKVEAEVMQVRRSIVKPAALLGKVLEERGLSHWGRSVGCDDPIKTDETLLRKLLINLTDYLRHEHSNLTVSCTVSAGRSATFSTLEFRGVEVPMTREEFEGLYRAYADADAAAMLLHGKLGLRLAVAKRLAQMLDGDIVLREVNDRTDLVVRIGSARANGPSTGGERTMAMSDGHASHNHMTVSMSQRRRAVVDHTTGEFATIDCSTDEALSSPAVEDPVTGLVEGASSTDDDPVTLDFDERGSSAPDSDTGEFSFDPAVHRRQEWDTDTGSLELPMDDSDLEDSPPTIELPACAPPRKSTRRVSRPADVGPSSDEPETGSVDPATIELGAESWSTSRALDSVASEPITRDFEPITGEFELRDAGRNEVSSEEWATAKPRLDPVTDEFLEEGLGHEVSTEAADEERGAKTLQLDPVTDEDLPSENPPDLDVSARLEEEPVTREFEQELLRSLSGREGPDHDDGTYDDEPPTIEQEDPTRDLQPE
ncbi:MAG: PAS domain-containing protein, partial [Planctomycetota bacterium]